MYMACRHILPNGLRCKSPALRGGFFCYFHSKLHTSSGCRSITEDVTIPLLEDPAAIQLALAEVFNALLSSRLDSRRAGQLLYGIQIAANTLQRNGRSIVESVEYLAQSEDGTEIAPELRVCDWKDECKNCPHADTCPNRRDDDEEDEDEEEEEETEETGPRQYMDILRRIEALRVSREDEEE